MAVKATHRWAMDGNIAAMEADLALGSAPAVGERERRRHANGRHGVALLCGFDTPSLTAQGGQRLLP